MASYITGGIVAAIVTVYQATIGPMSSWMVWGLISFAFFVAAFVAWRKERHANEKLRLEVMAQPTQPLQIKVTKELIPQTRKVTDSSVMSWEYYQCWLEITNPNKESIQNLDVKIDSIRPEVMYHQSNEALPIQLPNPAKHAVILYRKDGSSTKAIEPEGTAVYSFFGVPRLGSERHLQIDGFAPFFVGRETQEIRVSVSALNHPPRKITYKVYGAEDKRGIPSFDIEESNA